MKKIISFAIFIVMLAGCAAPASPSTSSTPVIEKTATLARTTDVSTLNTPLPTGLSPVQRCLRVDDKPSALKEVTSGTILQANALLDIQTGKKYKLPFMLVESTEEIPHYSLQVSPNGNMFAHIEAVQNNQHETANDILWIVDAHAVVLAKIPLDRKDLSQPRWLDNDRLVFYTTQTDIDGTVLVVNSITGEQTAVSNKLPGLYTERSSTSISWEVEYSPDLKSVIYLANIEAILRNVITKESLWESPHTNGDGKPVWSPDGQQVAVIGARQLYLVDNLGQAKPILGGQEEKQPSVPFWSPDGKKIVFWNFDSLRVYDLQADEIVDVCIYNQEYTIHAPSRWSPDSRQLMVYGFTQSGIHQGKRSPILLDLQKGVVYTNLQDIQNINPDVWMNSLP